MRKHVLQLIIGLFVLTFWSCHHAPNDAQLSESKYAYDEVPNDPLNARIYTLDNGLKVYLTVNNKEPRIQTYVAVRAGSKSDPAETTGLAHYLEHMVFKGTDEIGTLNYEKEKVLLDTIAQLYEYHRNTSDPEEKKAIYKKIDSVSYEASKLAVPNEYDKMISSLGAKGTNAYTWVEQTVYVNDIPANELEKWLAVESERFSQVVLRLFHTELETVYEEFNRSQDSDFRKSWKALMHGLFPNHPYGTQTTLGEGEHLKNPSMINIHKYFETYYVPNNVAICMSGDLDPDKTIELIDEYFGNWEPKDIPEFTHGEQPAYTEPLVEEAYGPQPEHVYVGFRLDGADTKDALMVQLVSALLNNGQAGLMDLNLTQKQKVLSASSYEVIMADYSAHILYGEPREGQTLEEVKDLLLAQIELIKNGEFDDWLLEAVVKNLKLDQIKAYENNRARADQFVSAFVWGLDWPDVVDDFEEMDSVTKEDLIEFVKQHYTQNRVEVYKRVGKDPNRHKVEKPVITPIVINRDSQSAFFAAFDTMEAGRLNPIFVDYQKEIDTETLPGKIDYSYIKNEFNELFALNYILDMGTDNDLKFGLAIKYLPYLGTDKYTAEELQKEFFKLGLSFDVNTSSDKAYVTLRGLDESFEEGLKLFEHVLHNVQPNEEAYNEMVKGILKERADAKLDKGAIMWSGMLNYGKYGPNSSFTHLLSEEDLNATSPDELVDQLKQLTSYDHRIFYYGIKDKGEVADLVTKYHDVPENLNDYPVAKEFPEQPTESNKVLFVNYDMVQTEMLLLSKRQPYDQSIAPYVSLFNEYFGAGLSSIVFQEIREAKALAYSAFCFVTNPKKKEDSHYVIAYIGTQADKLSDAAQAMIELMNDMPEAENQFNGARDAAMKKIESERVVGSRIFWNYETAKDRGLDYDIRKDVYEQLPQVELTDLKQFFDQTVKGREYTFLVIGNKENLDFEVLEKLGPVTELTLEELFNY